MKRSKAETAQTRKRILVAAIRAFKENGIQKTCVADVMTAAGLTHGGFYRHFDSKEQLVAEACAMSMEHLVEATGAAVRGDSESLLQVIERNLTTQGSEDTVGGCALASMGSELARADGATRRAASQGFEDLVDAVAKWMLDERRESMKDDAIFTIVSMIGAVTMSRVVDDKMLAERILDATKKRLLCLCAAA